jgi:hypothetical protein
MTWQTCKQDHTRKQKPWSLETKGYQKHPGGQGVSVHMKHDALQSLMQCTQQHAKHARAPGGN